MHDAITVSVCCAARHNTPRFSDGSTFEYVGQVVYYDEKKRVAGVLPYFTDFVPGMAGGGHTVPCRAAQARVQDVACTILVRRVNGLQ